MSIDQQSSMEGSTEESWPEIEHIRESLISTINEPATSHVPDIMNEECLDLPGTFTSSLQDDGLQFDILDPLPPPLTLPEGEMLVTPSIQQVDSSDSTTDMSPSIPVVVKTSDISTNNDQIKPTAGTDVNQEILQLIPQLGIRTPNDDTRPLSQIRRDMSEFLFNYIIKFAAQDILKFQCLGGEVQYQNGALLICAPSMDQAMNFADTVIDKYSETSLAVSLQQWDQLMEQHNGSNKFQKLVYPFSANPNIQITPIPSQQSHILPRIVFIGTIEAVENAYKFFHNNLPNEIPVDRIKWCGLQKHQPGLIPNIMRKYGVTITLHENMILLRDTSNSAQVHLARNELEQSLSSCFIASILHPLSPSLLTTLKGTIGHDVTVYNEEGLANAQFICGMSETRVRQVKEIVDHPFIKEVHVSIPVMESLKIKCVRDIKKIEQECMVDISYRGKKVLVKGYMERKFHTATRRVQDKVKALKYTKKNLNCPPAISAYVHHRLFEQQLSQADNEFLSSLQTKVFTENNQVWLEGADIEKDEQKLLEYLAPKKLQHQQFHFDSDSRFVPQIEKTLLCDLHKKHCFTHLISLQIERPDTPRKNYRTSSRSSLDSDYQPRPRISSRNEEGFTITIYSSNDEDFKHVSSFLKELNPCTKKVPVPPKCIDDVLKIQKKIEKQYSVRITVYKTDPTGVAIHGLRDSDIAACRDEIQQLVFVSHKIFLTRHKVVYLMRKCNQKLEELSKMCSKLSMPPLHDNDRNPSRKYYIFVSGKTKDVETVRQQLIELIGDQFNVEMFTVKSPDFMVGVWKRRWALVKNELEEKHDVIIDFSQSGAPQAGRRGSVPVTGRKVFKEDQQVVINFEVFGPDNEKVSEIRKHIEENENGRVVSVQIPVSENNRRVDHPSVLAQNANLQDMMVWLRFQGNQLLLFAPVSATDDLEAAKTALIHYLEETATKTENIDCIDELSFDILVNDCDFFLGKANAIAKQKHVTIRISKVKRTFVLNGSPSGIDVIKPLVDAALERVQKTIDTKGIEVSFIKAPFLKTPDFKQFCSSTRQKNLVDIIVSSSSSNEVVKQVQIQPFPTCHGLQVSLIRGDILKEDTDAIVNAANEDLEHIGGLAKSILDAAGSTIQEESRLYVHRYGKVNPGKAVCLSSGDLPCRKIIHAVAPRWKGGLENERAVLYNAVKMALQQAQKNNLATIAFPALGTGIFAVPVDVCAQASIQALRDYCNEKASSCVTDVRFVLNTSSACRAFLSTLDKFSKPSVLHATMPGMTWQWKDDTGKYNPYDPSICTKLTEQFRRDRSKVCSVILNGTTYNVDFQQMVQINTSTSFSRSIKFSFGDDTRESSMIEEDSKPQWYYKNDQEQWTPYLPNDSIQLETWYQSDMSGVLAIGKFQYSFDFEQMTQTNNRTKTKRSIKREVKGCSDDTESPKWYFQNDSQEFQPYLPEDSKQIEEWYQSGSQSNTLRIRRNTYSFDFTTMQQCNMLTGNKRVIKREGNDSEIIPQDLKPVMLKLRGARKSIDAVLIQLQSKLDGCLSNEELKLPEAIELSSIKRVVRKHGIEVTIRNVGTNQMATLTGVHDMLKKCHTEIQALIIAHMENKAGEMKFETPKEWQKQSETVEVFPVTVGSAEWNHVAHKFEETMSSSEIVSIERIQNQWLWQKYTQQRSMMHQKNNGKVNEMELFHGTRLNDPKSIYDSEEGFDMRFSAQGMWGQANYFAVNASYSNRYAHQLPDKSGNNQIFLAKVLTGDSSSCGSDSSLRMPPAKPSYAAATGGVKLAQLRYDTVTGSTGGSIVYMTYDNLKAYPAYLITYQQHKRFGFF